MPIRKAEAKSAADAASSGDVIEELRRRYDRLTQSQKRIAEYIVEHSQAVAFSTVDQMAAQLDVNPSTIVRFTYRLGLNGFPDLQERMRELVRGQLSRTGDPINEGQVAAPSGRHELRRLAQPRLAKSASHHIRSGRRGVRPGGQYSRSRAPRLCGRRILHLSGRALFRAGARSPAQRYLAARVQ